MSATSPTKSEELAAIRTLAVQLGPDSYFGRWLAERHAELTALIRSDIIPDLSLEQSQRDAARIRQEARTAAAEILAEAKKQATAEAERIRADANRDAMDSIRAARAVTSNHLARVRQFSRQAIDGLQNLRDELEHEM